MVLRKSFYIHWSAGRSPRVHEVNPGRGPSNEMDPVWVIQYNTVYKSLSHKVIVPSGT